MTVLAVVAALVVGPPPGMPDEPIMSPTVWKAVDVCDRKCRAVRRERRLNRMKRRVVAPYNSKLNRMAWCESTGRWFIATGNGFYGGLQFTLQTWRSVGGWGYPHQNSVLEQKYRAVILIKRAGYGPWPICGYS